MSRTFTLPELAESVVEGEIVAWLVGEGEPVALDQPLVEVMTDKVTVEIPSPFEGVLEAQLAQAGDVLPVGAPLARWSDGGDGSGEASGTGDGDEDRTNDGATATTDEEDDGSSLTLFTASGGGDDGPLPRVRKRPAAAQAGATGSGDSAPGAPDQAASTTASTAASTAARGPWGRPLAVPAARRRARELGVPLERVLGSGPHGRIRLEDVDASAPGGGAAPSGAAPGAAASAAAGATYAGSPLRAAPDGPEEARSPLRGLRRIVAQQMMHSHLSTVRTLHVDEADVSELVALRARLKPRAEARGVRLTYLPFVLRALVATLARHPRLNAWWDETTEEVVEARDAHVGVAVDSPRGLVVPVVRDASRRTLLDLAAETNRLAAAARDGTLAPDEVRGGTFSVTNVGAIGGLFSFPIIQAPQAAVLGVHAIKKRPVVLEDDAIVARSMLYLSLSFDHRLVDGADAVRFTNDLIRLLEAPEALLLDA
ncbi:MAG: dihydrolipoamide acetyltransferase family protein [Trueperaceae bacterium]